ncbi:hypothetical protein K501DRAFT_189540 [Backusella circina FSU 941]|nr:hypothetical protein K501DRAFT_189540 [Backusella circina FSU 941]
MTIFTTSSSTTNTTTTATSSSISSSAFSTASTAASTCPTSTFDNSDEERPCETYRQFMDSSRQERTFMIEKLVETFANVIDSIWHPRFVTEQHKVKVMPTRGFINEILKRSKATYSTVQISLFYVFRVKKVVHAKLMRRYNPKLQQPQTHMDDLMCCGRRMFLASLMVASKYLHDKNYQNKAWCKISGLDIKEVNAAEMAFLNLIDYRLHVSKPTFDKWYTQLHGHIQKSMKQGPTTTTTTMMSQKNAITISTSPTSSDHPLSPPSSQELPDHNSAAMSVNNADYPSPPPELDFKQKAELLSSKYSRSDSGIELGVLSPPTQSNELLDCSAGVKRQFDHDNSSDMSIIITNKRQCQ